MIFWRTERRSPALFVGACQWWQFTKTHCAERELKKTGGKARLQAAAVRVADALAGRAAKRVRFAEGAGDQVVDSAGVQTDPAAEAQDPVWSSSAAAGAEASGKQRGGQLFSCGQRLQLCSCSTRSSDEWRSEQLFQLGSVTPES